MKAIILLQPSGDIIGGAQKRYLNIIKYLLDNNPEYIVILNDCLYKNVIKYNILEKSDRIKSIKLGFSCVNIERKKASIATSLDNSQKREKKIWVIKILGRIKYFVKLAFNWGLFVFQFSILYAKYKFEKVYGIWYGGMWVWPLKYIFGFDLVYSYNDSGHSSVKRDLSNLFSSEYLVLKNADKIDFLSQGLIDGLERINVHVRKDQIAVTPNTFIDYTNFFPIEKENCIVFLSRLSPIKNPILFLEAIKKIDTDLVRLNYKVLIFGSGLLENEIKEFISLKNLMSVQFNGSTLEPWKHLQKSKIFISIQEQENYPSQVLIEAMACENAVVVSDVGETRKLVSESEGILVSLDSGDIAEKILFLLENPIDCQMRGKHARQKVIKEHTIENFMRHFHALMR